MRTTTVCAMILAVYAVGCDSDPLSHLVDAKHISSLPSDKMTDANRFKANFGTAKKAMDVAKLKLKYYELELEAARRYTTAADFQVKATREKIALSNKGVKMTIPAGILDKVVKEAALAKKNLEYRQLLFELHEKRVEYLELNYHLQRANYFEKVVNVIHGQGNAKLIEKHKKSEYIKQAAEQKIKVAEALSEVEKGLSAIKALEAQIKPEWAPSMSCKPAAYTPATTTPSSGGPE
jgi:hypothetical protein